MDIASRWALFVSEVGRKLTFGEALRSKGELELELESGMSVEVKVGIEHRGKN